jgi:CO/xanthine dehydrogenase FAD-binding subunit
MTLNAHPALPEFDYVQPATLVEASQFLAAHKDEARPFLGGTDVFVRMRDGFMHPKFLVDVKNLEKMKDIRFDPGEGLTLGAGVSMNQVIASPDVQAHYPLLVEACRSVASYQLRTRATIVGNICNASPAGDTIGACLVFDGQLYVHGVEGSRVESLANFFLGPGKTMLKVGDIVTAIHLPPPPRGGAGAYLKLGRNKLSDLSIVGVTVLGYPAAAGYRFRIALASVAPIPLVPAEAETYLAERISQSTRQPGSEDVHEIFAEAARLAAKACSPIDDVRGSGRYRRAMVRSLTAKGLGLVWQQINREG